MRCLSLFSGAGGLDIGLEAAGFEILANVEADADCCNTLRLNGAQCVIAQPIERVDPQILLEEIRLRPGELDLLAGGPPCQPFSKSALWASGAAQGLLDQRARTLDHYFTYVAQLRPKAFLIENVEGFKNGGGIDYVESRVHLLREHGLDYVLNWRLIDAAEFGVAQHRRRLFGVGLLRGFEFSFPHARFGTRDEPFLTAWDACSDASRTDYVEDLTIKGRWAQLIPSIPEGQNYLWHTARGGGEPLFGWRTRYWSFLLKLSKNKPSPTLVANPSQNSGPFHWDNRLLSTPELARIQGFPISYRFAGGRASRQRQIGNAVPPPLAAALGRQIIHALGREPNSTASLLIPRASATPPVAKVDRVPETYLVLRGEHEAHPGTGRGPRPRNVLTLPTVSVG
ncbi:MAG TPA: DNA cytosine methyltransferase [Microvirga sp.]|jgi:DNA (cytosine-5)-methyltransferase 1|nr:DNA cytosine methyltransferase [Microvirga sp.]